MRSDWLAGAIVPFGDGLSKVTDLWLDALQLLMIVAMPLVC